MPKPVPTNMQEGCTHKTNFGDVVVTEYKNSGEVCVRFIDTGFETVATAGNLRKGRVKDFLVRSAYNVGYLGVGQHKTKESGKPTKAYNVWKGMLSRCYDASSKKFKNYGAKGVYVDPEWHSFQAFAEWFYNQHPEDGGLWHLDKDINHVGVGPKCYGPNTCMFVTPKENINARSKYV